MPEFTRGRKAIEDGATRKGGGGGRFVPDIFWKEDGEKKYVLILTPVDEVPRVDLHQFLPIEREKSNGETFKTFESVLVRTDAAIGEDSDPIQDQFGLSPTTRYLGAAVELDPTFKVERGRKRPKGFAVKTSTFTRYSDDGEEDVEAPNLGIITQSSSLMWSPLMSLDESQGPLSELPVEVVRRGTGRDTRYDFVPYVDQQVDVMPLLENIDGIGYLQNILDEALAAVEAEDTELGAAMAVARLMFEKRLDELADLDHYEEILGSLNEDDLKNHFGRRKSEDKPKAKRPARKSSPRKKKDEAPEAEAEAETEESDESDEDRNSRFAELRARVAAGK